MDYILKDKILSIDVNTIFEESIQDFFDAYIPSKKIQHLLIQNKWIDLDGNQVKRESDIVGNKLNINLYPELYNYKHLDNKIDIIYEDEFILVINKPKDLIIHSDEKEEITLNKMVESYYQNDNHIAIHPLHRLDKDTGGLIVYSKSIIFQPLFDKLMEEKQIRRSYLAFVEGIYDQDDQVINKPIGKDRHQNNKFVINSNGQKAITKVKLVGVNKRKNYSILRCILDTGRSHQIRVHLSSIGYPIINDEIYGHQNKIVTRMGLFADNITFFHPLKQEMIEIECSLPKELEELYQEV